VQELQDNAAIGLQDVDSFFWLLKEVAEEVPTVSAIWVMDNVNASQLDPASKQTLLRPSAPERTFESEGTPPEFATARCHLADLNNCANPLAERYHSPPGVALFWNTKDITIIQNTSPVTWINWGQSQRMAYGYAPQSFVTMQARHNSTQSDISITVAACSWSGESTRLDSVLSAIGIYRNPIVLADTGNISKHALDRCLARHGFLEAVTPPTSFVLHDGVLSARRSNTILTKRADALHWSCATSASWSPPPSHVEILAALLQNTSANATLSDACQTPNRSLGPDLCSSFDIIYAQEQDDANDEITKIARILNMPKQRLYEALMCLQPHTYAPSTLTPSCGLRN
jgi:hypothetical protein